MKPDTSIQHYRNSEILIVGDIEANKVQLEKILTQAGYRVRVVSNAGLAIDSIKEKIPSLVFLDVSASGIDGGELCHWIKADELTQDIPVIFISDPAQGKEIPNSFELGAVDFISIPFNDTEILVRVATHLALYHARQELKQKNVKLQAEVAERKKAEEELRASETLFKTIFNEAPLGITLVDSDTGRAYSTNLMYTKITGRTSEEMNNIDWMKITHPDDLQKDLDNMALMNAGKISGYQMEKRFIRHDGTYLWINMTITPISVTDAAHPRHICMIENITERKQSEIYRDMEREILQAATMPKSLQEMLEHFVSILYTRTEFEAVGIRLKDGDDFPYIVHKGFSKDFLRTENSLIEHTPEGGICRDDTGNICMECTCGMVLTGTTNSSNPLFTKGGSFWTNDSSNGYASTALVPIRIKNEIIGLIHLNDHHKGRLTSTTIELLEEVALHIGTALMQKKSEEAQRISELRYRAFIDASSDLIFLKDERFRYLISNKANSAFLGASEDRLIGHTDFDFVPEEAAKICRASDQEVLNKKRNVITEESIGPNTYETIKFPVPLLNGNIGIGSIIRNITEQKKANEKVQRERVFFNQLVAMAPEGIVIADTKHKIIQINTEFIKMFGFTSEEAIGKSVDDLVIPPNKGMEAQALTQSVGEGKSFLVETVRRRKDGSLLNVSIIGAPIRIAGEFEGMFAIYRDITERKQMYDALRESNEYLDNLITSANAPIIVWDSRLKITRFNHAFEKLSGKKAETVIGKDIGLLFPEARKEECLHYIQQSNKKDRWDVVEIPVIGKDGVVHIVLWSSATIYGPDEKTAIATIAQCQDITSRILAEEVIQKSESILKRLVAILQHPSETIQEFLDFALEQAIQLSESKIGYIYHYSEDRKVFVLNTWSKDVMQECSVSHPPVTYDLDKTGIWGEAVRQRGPIVVNDFPAANPLKKGTPEGHVQLLKFMTVPIFRDKKIVGVVGLANKETDYTETDILQTSLLLESVWKVVDRKKAEEDLRTLNSTLDQQIQKRTNELQVTNKELEAFSYSVSHDLRAPLRSIEGFSKIFLEEYGAAIPEKGHHYLERVRSDAVHMGELIDSLLKLSQVSRSSLSLKNIDLSVIAEQAVKETANENLARKVNVQIEPGMMVMADPLLMHIVLMNLITNAWKFTSKRECAHINVGRVIDPQHGPAFFVRDDGAGFDNGSAGKLFSAFQRLHTEKEFVGTGIGLATIARIIHRHGGEVWAKGEVDKGATFYFSIPDPREHHKLD